MEVELQLKEQSLKSGKSFLIITCFTIMLITYMAKGFIKHMLTVVKDAPQNEIQNLLDSEEPLQFWHLMCLLMKCGVHMSFQKRKLSNRVHSGNGSWKNNTKGFSQAFISDMGNVRFLTTDCNLSSCERLKFILWSFAKAEDDAQYRSKAPASLLMK